MSRYGVGDFLPESHRQSGFLIGRHDAYAYGHEKKGQRVLVWDRVTGEVKYAANDQTAEKNIRLAHDAAWKLNGGPLGKVVAFTRRKK